MRMYVHMFCTCRMTEQDVIRCRESAKAEKSEIEALYTQYQFELDNLIKTENRLREMYVCIHILYSTKFWQGKALVFYSLQSFGKES